MLFFNLSLAEDCVKGCVPIIIALASALAGSWLVMIILYMLCWWDPYDSGRLQELGAF